MLGFQQHMIHFRTRQRLDGGQLVGVLLNQVGDARQHLKQMVWEETARVRGWDGELHVGAGTQGGRRR